MLRVPCAPMRTLTASLLLAAALVPSVAAQVPDRPLVASAIGLSRTEVKLSFKEPVGSLTAQDVALTMGGELREVAAVQIAPDNRSAKLAARPAWPYATAGEVSVGGAKAVRVWASPGDMTPPVLSSVRLASSTICVTGLSRVCAVSGGSVSYAVDEPVTIVLDLRHRASDAPSLLRVSRPAGRGTVRFNEKIEGRRLRPGRYRLTVTAVDPAGNESRAFTLSLRVRR